MNWTCPKCNASVVNYCAHDVGQYRVAYWYDDECIVSKLDSRTDENVMRFFGRVVLDNVEQIEKLMLLA